MKKLIFVILYCLLLVGITTGCSSKSKTENAGTDTTTSQTEAPDKKYIKLAEKENEKLPEMYSGGVRLDKVEAVSKTEFRYLYTFTKKPEIGRTEFKRHFKLPMTMALQETNDGIFKEFKKDRMTLIYTYMLMNGKLFAEMRIEPEEYIKD